MAISTESSSINSYYVSIEQKLTITEEKLREIPDDGEMIREFESEKKEVTAMSNVKYFLQLFKNMADDEEGQFELFLNLLGNVNEKRVHGKFSFFVKSANYFTQHDYVFEENEDSWGDDICSANEFFNAKRKFILDGKFTVEMKGILIFEDTEIPKVIYESSTLCQALWQRDDKDFKFNVGNEGSIMIHKVVLASRSNHFENMLKSGMKESISNTLEIIDFHLDTAKLAVEFFYDRNIFESLSFVDAFELLRFADKYNIADLQDKLELHLIYQLSPSAICTLANGSISSNSEKLRQICFNFLMICLRHAIPVDNIGDLNSTFAAEIFQKALSPAS
uniref:BTB domain-containing protein n=1 Tax=Panagrolaimus sp. ES5 TaxID=591445 RepID=A0AC34FAG1_9BILA